MLGARALLAVVVCITFSMRAAALGEIRRVPSQYPTIQDAIDASNNGDLVLVAAGTYTGPGNWDLNFQGKGIRVVGSGAQSCIIDCGGPTLAHRAVTFVNEPPGTALGGFTIRNANMSSSGAASDGGAVLVLGGAPTIGECDITDCSASRGGGIAVLGGVCRVVRCYIARNDADGFGTTVEATGGGIALIDGTLSVYYSWIDQNSAISSGLSQPAYGGGIACFGTGSALLQGVTVSNNLVDGLGLGSSLGGGVYAGAASTRIEGGTYRDNTAGASGIGQGGGIWSNKSTTLRGGVVIEGNVSSYIAGGLGMGGGTLTVSRAAIFGNSADLGGGFGSYASGTASFRSCIINGNRATTDGGGGMFQVPTTLSSCTLTLNDAANRGGGMYISGAATVHNSIVWGNTSSSSQGNELFVGANSSATYSNIDNRSGDIVLASATFSQGAGMLHVDPKFIDADGPDNIAGTYDDDLRLQPFSPCIDSGSNSLIPLGEYQDLDGRHRRAEDLSVPNTGSGTAPITDMGAYERLGLPATIDFGPIFFKLSNTGTT